MRKHSIIWGLIFLFLVTGCTVTVVEEATPAQPVPTATMHPIFVPGGGEVDSVDMFSSLAITGTVTTASPEPESVASPTPEGEINEELPTTEAETLSTPTATPEPPQVRQPGIDSEDVYTRTLEVPVLMYHHIVPPGGPTGEFAVDADSFLEQINYLASNRYNTIDFYDLTQALKGEVDLPNNPIILTFDNGYLDNFEQAFPILSQYAYTGTFFLVTDYLDDGRDGYMTWDMVKRMVNQGHRFEPHSRTNADLRDRERDFLFSQILDSQEAIAENIGYTPRFFAYPGGRYDEGTIQVLEELDFWGAVTTAGGTEFSYEQRYEWPRLYVPGDMTLLEFIDFIEKKEPLDIQNALDTGEANVYTLSPGGFGPTATVTATLPITLPIYGDNLDPAWIVRNSPDLRFKLQDGTEPHDGFYAISVSPQEDFGSLYFQVRPDAGVQYLRDQVLGLSFWIYSEEPLATNDLAVAISGSDDYPYWTATDQSVNLTEYDPLFDAGEAYYLNLNRAIEPETWTRVELLLDDLTYDTNYEYITGVHLKNNADFDKTVFIDQIQLILASVSP